MSEHWLVRAAATVPERAAIETADGVLDYRELARRAGAGARELGVEPGERVALALEPGAAFSVALHACFLAGAVAVPIDLRDPLAAERIGEFAVVVDRPLDVSGAAAKATELDLDSVALVVRTSGTSGAPRDVPLTYGNFLWSAIGSAVALGLDPRERWLCTLPLVHVGGLSILIRSAIYQTTAIVHERFDADRAVAALMEGGATLVSVVATTLARLLDAGLERPAALRCALAGGGPVPSALVERATAAGVAVSQTYGLTEACSQVATQRPGRGASADAGPALFCTHVEIAPDGEILVSGPTVSPAAGGVLATGDIGELDHAGNLRVIARKGELIISGGENVAPAEVEAVLCEHPAVREAGVYGVADAEWGEAVWAAVVLRAQASDTELAAHCAARLPAYKVPKRIDVVEALPRTGSGKLRRSELSAMAGCE
jgi:O-succinylbenzoic acid--CoA ligase